MVTFVSSIVLSNAVALKVTLIANIPEADVVVNAEKDFVLEGVDTYSRKVDDGIIHTFVPLNGLCTSLPSTEVCLRVLRWTERSSTELGTVLSLPWSNRLLSRRKKDDISVLIRRHISNVLLNHRAGGFLSYVTSNFHFFDNEFYVITKNDPSVDRTSENSLKRNQEIIPYDAKNAPTIILEHLRSHKVGFNFLTDEEIRIVLLPVMSSIDKSYTCASLDQLMYDFSRLMISQTVNVFRSCSINQDNPSYPVCLIISTLFVRPQPSTTDTYKVYHLHPLPISMNVYRYVHINLPKTFGFNVIDRSLIAWNDEREQSRCIFSKIVQYSEEPISVSLLKTQCLSELFNRHSTQTSACELARSTNVEPTVSDIAHNICLFNSFERVQYCKPQSHKSKSNEIVIINESTIIQLPCGTAIKCSDVQIPSSKCSSGTVLVNSLLTGTYEKQMNFRICLAQLATKLISAHRTNLRNLLNEMQQDVDENTPVFKRIMEKFSSLIQYLILLLMLIIILTAGKYTKIKLSKQLNKVEREVNKMSDIFLNGDSSV